MSLQFKDLTQVIENNSKISLSSPRSTPKFSTDDSVYAPLKVFGQRVLHDLYKARFF